MMTETGPEPLTPLTGLFLGAGASYELGMPLVSGLTKEIKDWLTADQLRALNEGWRGQGGGFPDSVIDNLAHTLARSDMHYESIIGFLESQVPRAQRRVPRTPQDLEESQGYYSLVQWLLELVYFVLYFRHIRNEPWIQSGLRYFEGIAGLAASNLPLWIFSLNHDLMVECTAAEYGVPLNSGLTGLVTVPRRNRTGATIGELHAEIIREDEIKRNGMPFWQPGTRGINLLKIHGALDVFWVNDGNDLIKLRPTGPGVHGLLDSLRAANEELIYIKPGMLKPAKVINYVTYEDENGEPQILARSLLAGAHKFGQAERGLFPKYFLDSFKFHINFLSSLICIGYGFGDDHINKIILEWLEFSHERRLTVVRPGTDGIPAFLLHLAHQVEAVDSTATDFLSRFVPKPLSESEQNQKRFRTEILTRGMSQAFEDAQERILEDFRQQFQTLALTFTVDRRTGQTVVDLATVATAEGLDLAQYSPRELMIAKIRRWLISDEIGSEKVLSFGNPVCLLRDDPVKRTDAVYRHMVVLAQQAMIAQQLSDYDSGILTPTDALANLIYNRLDVEHPNPDAPAVEIDTLYLTLVTQDGGRTDFTVEFGFPAPTGTETKLST